MEHHTKTKGDAGVGFVLADCLQNNVQVCLPISEHLAFDVVVVSPEGALRRLQVKYVTAKKGAITVDIRGCGRIGMAPTSIPATTLPLMPLPFTARRPRRCTTCGQMSLRVSGSTFG